MPEPQSHDPIQKVFGFDGAWMPDFDPSKMGEENFSELKNYRYVEDGIEPIEGYSAITSTAVNATYSYIRDGIQLRQNVGTETSFVIVFAWDSGETAGRVYQNTTAIPTAGDFTTAALFTPTSPVNPRFSRLPRGIGMCTEAESVVYEGNEAYPGIVTLCDSISGLSVTNGRDFTTEVTNSINDANNKMGIIATARTFLIGTTRPIQGFKVYIATANATASTMSVKYWDGSAWTAVSTLVDNTDTGPSLAQTGTVTFDSTVSTAKPSFIDNVYLYHYQVSIDDGTAEIYQITVDMPMQGIVDIWDGVFRTCVSNQVQINGGAYSDYTLEVNEESNIDFAISGKFQNFGQLAADKWYIASEEQATGFKVELLGTKQNTDDSALGIKYWDGDSWVNVGKIYDTTMEAIDGSGEKTMNNSGVVSWQAPAASAEKAQTKFGTTAHFYQIQAALKLAYTSGSEEPSIGDTLVGATGGATATLVGISLTSGTWAGADAAGTLFLLDQTGTFQSEDVNISGGSSNVLSVGGNSSVSQWTADVEIDFISLIPAQRVLRPHRFPAKFATRAFFCGDIQGGEPNALDYTAAQTIDVHNGFDSSALGQRIYVGDKEAVTAARSVYNRFGSSIYETLLVYKNNETYLLTGSSPVDFRLFRVSENYGCPAPRTLTGAEVGYEMGGGATRNVVMWLSYRGPVIFDGAVIQPIKGVDLYFDTRKSTVINFGKLANCVAWFDPFWKEWHLLIPSGSTQTTLNVHLVYDMDRKKWWKVNYDGGAADIPQFGMIVRDSNGAAYPYVFRNDGHCLRFGNGSDWAGNNLTHLVKTADIIPAGFWHETQLNALKVGHQVPDFVATDEDISLTITAYINGAVEGETLEAFTIDVTNFIEETPLTQEDDSNILLEDGSTVLAYDKINKRRYTRKVQGMDQVVHSVAFEFSRTSTSASYLSNFGKSLLWWGFLGNVAGKDERGDED